MRTQLRLQEKCCANLLDVSWCYLTTLSIADILEFGWRMNERKKKTGGIILTGETDVPRQHPVRSSILCTKTPTLTDLWLNPRLSVQRFKDVVQIWIFMYSKWQKINCYTLTGKDAQKFLPKLCLQLCENVFFFVATLM